MSNLLNVHAKRLKSHIKKYSRSVVFTDVDGNSYDPVLVIWNDVEHGLNINGFDAEPMGAKSSIFIDTDTFNTLSFSPSGGWKITGSPNDYVDSADYFIEIPKKDYQLPGQLFFLAKDNGEDQGWNKAGAL